jgi:cell wall-associated NlpC family hydrolase
VSSTDHITIEDPRAAVIAEARSWIGTPFHHRQRVKGAGVDCGQLPLAVYEAAGIIPHVEVPHYPPDFAMHSEDPWYLRIIEQFAHPVETPRPADFAIFMWGRTHSHGAIVVDWPMVIHAWAFVSRVIEMSADVPRLQFLGKTGKRRDVRFYSPFAD